MKQLNGEPVVRFQILATLECSQEQADYILGASEAEALSRFGNMVRSLQPINETVYTHQVNDFKTDYGKALVEKRQSELKQLTNSAPA